MANFKEDLLKTILAKTQKLTKQVNQRLLRLEREIGKDIETTEMKNLHKYLDTKSMDAWTKSGRVSYSKIKMDPFKLDRLNKELTKFIEKPSTTVRGIRKELKQARETHGVNFDYKDLFDFKDIEEDLEDWIMRYIPPSKFDALNHYAIDHNLSEDEYVVMIIKQADSKITNDEDAIEKIKRLYQKYVVGG